MSEPAIGLEAPSAGPPPVPPNFEEAVEKFCLGQAELRARLARPGADGPRSTGDEGGGHGDGQG